MPLTGLMNNISQQSKFIYKLWGVKSEFLLISLTTRVLNDKNFNSYALGIVVLRVIV